MDVCITGHGYLYGWTELPVGQLCVYMCCVHAYGLGISS